MPPVTNLSTDRGAFTIINHDEEKPTAPPEPPAAPSRVLAVRPVPRVPPEPPPQTILDPKFSRALDFKLRRLKQREVIASNLRRPTRRTRRSLTTSEPDVREAKDSNNTMSRSHPRIDIIAPEDDKRNLKVSPKMDKSPSPAGKGRTRNVSVPSEGDKPRFVTTVKTGCFLPPPPQYASLLGLEALYPAEEPKLVYSYASKPQVLAPRSKRSVKGKPEPTDPVTSQRPHAGHMFAGVRALVAGVVGMGHNMGNNQKQKANDNGPYSNVMHDKRVVRGSTFAAHPHAQGDGHVAGSAAARAALTRRRAMARRAAARLRPGTPPPAPGRRHHPIQTDYYLEELFDKGVELSVGVQTDLFLDRPATPVYVPAKTGADAETQIYPGDLFDFDLEVGPVLEVLVGGCAEQALAEVAREEELATLREHQRRFRELRDAERAERDRLRAQAQRLDTERAARVAEAKEAAEAVQETRARAAAATLVQGYVADLLPSVLAGLRDQGYLVDRIHRGVDDEFMPWLVREVSNEIESVITSRDVITELVREVVEARADLYARAGARTPRGGTPDSETPFESEGEEEEDEHLEE